jgi:hypothetical protein
VDFSAHHALLKTISDSLHPSGFDLPPPSVPSA